MKKLNLTIRVKVDKEQDRAYEPHVYVFLEDDLTYLGMVNNKDPVSSYPVRPLYVTITGYYSHTDGWLPVSVFLEVLYKYVGLWSPVNGLLILLAYCW